MGDVIKLNTYKIEKQYKQYRTSNINLALDNVKQEKVTLNIRHNYIKAYMRLLSK
jgi:hypothetical protein